MDNVDDIAPDLLERAARLALSSRHPLAVALASEAHDRTPFESAKEEPGQGVRASIDGVEARLGNLTFCGIADSAEHRPADEVGVSIIAFHHGDDRAIFKIRQRLRQDAAATASALAACGLDLRILSGDRPEAVAPIAMQLGISHRRGGLNPAQKITAIEAWEAAGQRVLMVGDGINDAPALAAAHVSLSPISAAHITQAQADAVFLGDRLKPVLDALIIGCRARRLMQQNLWLAVIYNVIAVPVAMTGHVTPLIAAIAMSGSSILVTLNALRARGRDQPGPRSEVNLIGTIKPNMSSA